MESLELLALDQIAVEDDSLLVCSELMTLNSLELLRLMGQLAGQYLSLDWDLANLVLKV